MRRITENVMLYPKTSEGGARLGKVFLAGDVIPDEYEVPDRVLSEDSTADSTDAPVSDGSDGDPDEGLEESVADESGEGIDGGDPLSSDDNGSLASTVAAMSVKDVIADVGADADMAARVLEVEQGREGGPRPTLVTAMELLTVDAAVV